MDDYDDEGRPVTLNGAIKTFHSKEKTRNFFF